MDSAFWQGFAALPAVFYHGFDVCHSGWSLFYLCVGFSLLHTTALHSHAWAPHFPDYFPFRPFFYQGCFLPGLCKITYLFPAAGLDLRCPAGSNLAANAVLMLFTLRCVSHLASHHQLCGDSQVLSESQTVRCSHCWGKSFAPLCARAEHEQPEGLNHARASCQIIPAGSCKVQHRFQSTFQGGVCLSPSQS